MGTAFIFATFIFTTNDFIQFTSNGQAYGRFSIIFSLTGSVIGCYIGSALTGKGRVGYKECLTGVISGGVVIAGVAPILINIGLIIMIGFLTGIFSGIYMRTLHVKINKNYVYDTLGLLGPFFIASFLGSFVIIPSVMAYYYNNGISMPGVEELVPENLPGWQLTFVGITVGVAAGAGLLCGVISLCDKDSYALASNSRFFMNIFGLYDAPDDDDDVVIAERDH